MIYTEPGRVSVYELMAHSRLTMPGEKLLRLNLTVDIMTAVQSYLQAVGMQMTFRKLEGDVGDQLWTKYDEKF